MRLDHYIKTGDNNIHLANILWSIGLIVVITGAVLAVLERSITADFAQLKILVDKRR